MFCYFPVFVMARCHGVLGKIPCDRLLGEQSRECEWNVWVSTSG